MNNADFWVALLEAEDDFRAAMEAEREIVGQYQSEIALCGDAWPGAFWDVQRVQKAVDAAEKRFRDLEKLI